MCLRVNESNVHIFMCMHAHPRQKSTPGSYHHPQIRAKLLITQAGFFQKSISSHPIPERNPINIENFHLLCFVDLSC